MTILVYIRLLFFLRLSYNCLSSLLGSMHSLSKCPGLFIAEAFTGRSGFSRPILIKGCSWCIPVE